MIELEAELGSTLFERTSRGMVLTPQGHRFLASARKVHQHGGRRDAAARRRARSAS